MRAGRVPLLAERDATGEEPGEKVDQLTEPGRAQALPRPQRPAPSRPSRASRRPASPRRRRAGPRSWMTVCSGRLGAHEPLAPRPSVRGRLHEAGEQRVQSELVGGVGVELGQLPHSAGQDRKPIRRERRQPPATRGLRGIDGEARGLRERVAARVADRGAVDAKRGGGVKPWATSTSRSRSTGRSESRGVERLQSDQRKRRRLRERDIAQRPSRTAGTPRASRRPARARAAASGVAPRSRRAAPRDWRSGDRSPSPRPRAPSPVGACSARPPVVLDQRDRAHRGSSRGSADA